MAIRFAHGWAVVGVGCAERPDEPSVASGSSVTHRNFSRSLHHCTAALQHRAPHPNISLCSRPWIPGIASCSPRSDRNVGHCENRKDPNIGRCDGIYIVNSLWWHQVLIIQILHLLQWLDRCRLYRIYTRMSSVSDPQAIYTHSITYMLAHDHWE